MATKPASNKVTLPDAIVKAAASNVAATLGRAISSHLEMPIDLKAFRDTLRRKHGYVSGKHGAKLTLTNDVAASMLSHYESVKARRSNTND